VVAGVVAAEAQAQALERAGGLAVAYPGIGQVRRGGRFGAQAIEVVAGIYHHRVVVGKAAHQVEIRPLALRVAAAAREVGSGGKARREAVAHLPKQLRNGVAGSVTSAIDAINLEKLEVIKGPSATLYGSALTSFGGLLNRVTKKPYETFGGEVAVSAGSYGFHRVSADVNTPLNKAKTLAFRLNTAYNYEDSWQNAGYAGFVKNLAIAPSLQFRPNDKLTINLDAEVYRGTNVGKQLVYFTFGDPIKNLGFSRADEAPL
nr:hypothetical protein [Tanacetum cinerariifolium]